MVVGAIERRTEGTPQGSPLSPLLFNIVLDELDKELERRGHQFVRYADEIKDLLNELKLEGRSGLAFFDSQRNNALHCFCPIKSEVVRYDSQGNLKKQPMASYSQTPLWE